MSQESSGWWGAGSEPLVLGAEAALPLSAAVFGAAVQLKLLSNIQVLDRRVSHILLQ